MSTHIHAYIQQAKEEQFEREKLLQEQQQWAMYVCMYVCAIETFPNAANSESSMCACVHVRMYACIYNKLELFMHECMYAYMHISNCKGMCICMYVCMSNLVLHMYMCCFSGNIRKFISKGICNHMKTHTYLSIEHDSTAQSWQEEPHVCIHTHIYTHTQNDFKGATRVGTTEGIAP